MRFDGVPSAGKLLAPEKKNFHFLAFQELFAELCKILKKFNKVYSGHQFKFFYFS